MQKKWTCLGLMSGTSGDGVDASIINTNGLNDYESIQDDYFEYSSGIYEDIHNLKSYSYTNLTLTKKRRV